MSIDTVRRYGWMWLNIIMVLAWFSFGIFLVAYLILQKEIYLQACIISLVVCGAMFAWWLIDERLTRKRYGGK